MATIGLVTVVLFTSISLFGAERISDATLRSVANNYLEKQPASGIPKGVPYDEAIKAQSRYLKLIEPKLGSKAGYKVGFVTPAAQERFGISHPVRGALYEKMLLPNNSAVPAAYGTRPILEPDLIVRVKDEGINQAETIEDAARHLSEIVCFIELADSIFATDEPVDAGVVVSANVGARLGVLGEARAIESNKAFIDAFGRMALVLRDRDGKELSRVTAEGIMGHPLNAVLWLVKDLKRTGEKLRAGDVISLGSPSPQVAPQPGEEYTLIYEGLPGGALRATVSIR